jgi:hypothetical protein
VQRELELSTIADFRIVVFTGHGALSGARRATVRSPPGPGADVGGGGLIPGADVGGGGPSPGADVACVRVDLEGALASSGWITLHYVGRDVDLTER